MCGPGFEPDASLALPEAMIAVMGPEAAVNAVYANKIEAMPEGQRPEYIEKLRAEFKEDIDVYRLASELIVDQIVAKDDLRNELIARFDIYSTKEKDWPLKKRAVTPV